MILPSQRQRLQHYVTRYGEPEVQSVKQALALVSPQRVDYCAVVPAYKESLAFIHHYMALAENLREDQSICLIVVINQPDSAISPHEDNQSLLTFLSGKPMLTKVDNIGLHQLSPRFTVLSVDRFSQHRIPHKQGVGLARKIGVDIACQLYLDEFLSSSWVGSTDADARPNGDYLQTVNACPDDHSAQVFEFEHIRDTNNDVRYSTIFEATQRYEKSLRYYVDGLGFTQSEYAFHTIGSAFAIELNYYAQVRGFPKRAAGEDFYLLNKLRKVGPIFIQNEYVLPILSRVSDRVPFGTGPAVDKMLQSDNADKTWPMYHPLCFYALKALLYAVKVWIKQHSWGTSDLLCKSSLMPMLSSLITELQAELMTMDASSAQYLKAALSPSCLDHWLETIKLDEFICHSGQMKKTAQAEHHWLIWFDGLKTLKAVHWLRNHVFPSLSYEQWHQHPLHHFE
ncbi:hypothetical protein HQQ94_18095 [Shewanella sp. VB17]|uniref:hypothetical protein n=1 Tax=Shewanella sp. VB17 TaxID=2739432 RepID=UPI001566C44B|nr:hypothetical protein [Shewanella sp. VB17]NRD75094.1 hypothetical protein [Shewanella sp. VB17]